MEDPYEHEDPMIGYTPCNVPGRGCDAVAFDDSFAEGCACEDNCASKDACACLERSLGSNFDEVSGFFLKLGSSLPVLECNPACKCSLSKCSNRVVQLGPLKGLRIAGCPGKGLGLFTAAAISRGAFVCEYAGEVIGPSEAEARSLLSSTNFILHVNESYSGGRRQEQIIVDPTSVGNIGRYANHSCAPNLTMHPVRSELASVPHLALFANKDVAGGEELCFDYAGAGSVDAIDRDGERTPCQCGANICRKFLPCQNVT